MLNEIQLNIPDESDLQPEDVQHSATAGAPQSFGSLNLEVGVDLLQQPSRKLDVIGGHQLPLEDGQRDVGARGQIQISNWLQGRERSAEATGFGVTLKRDDLHVGHRLLEEQGGISIKL